MNNILPTLGIGDRLIAHDSTKQAIYIGYQHGVPCVVEYQEPGGVRILTLPQYLERYDFDRVESFPNLYPRREVNTRVRELAKQSFDSAIDFANAVQGKTFDKSAPKSSSSWAYLGNFVGALFGRVA